MTVKTIALHEASHHLSELIDRVQAGEVIAITRQGRPCAHLIAAPVAAQPTASVAAAFQRLAALRRHVVLEDDLKSVAREGLD